MLLVIYMITGMVFTIQAISCQLKGAQLGPFLIMHVNAVNDVAMMHV